MKLWSVVRNDRGGYDTFDSMVVAAETEQQARETHPYGHYHWNGRRWVDGDHDERRTWTDPDCTTATEIGTAIPNTPAGVICASFNAG